MGTKQNLINDTINYTCRSSKRPGDCISSKTGWVTSLARLRSFRRLYDPTVFVAVWDIIETVRKYDNKPCLALKVLVLVSSVRVQNLKEQLWRLNEDKSCQMSVRPRR